MRIHQMTVSLTTGDAIGNYVLSLRRILADLGYQGEIFADFIHPSLGHVCWPSAEYRPSGCDVLWFHYSIGADNFRFLEHNPDRMVIDFHGVTPAHFMRGHHRDLERRAQQALAALPSYRERFRLCIIHSDAGGQVLRQNGYPHPEKVPYVVDAARLNGVEDQTLSRLLANLEYLLFVGRIVPNKGIRDLVYVLEQLKQWRPDIKLALVGDTTITSSYVRQLQALAQRLGLQDDVLLTGKVPDEMLVSFFKHATLMVTLSEHEMFCVPVIESLHFGVPAVCNDIPALREVLGEAGLLVQRERHAETAAAIRALLDDQPRYKQLQTMGQARAAQFTSEVLQARLRTLLPLIVG